MRVKIEKQIIMTSEEQYVRDHMGKENPFRVPEGYFDSLVSNVMEQLPPAVDAPEATDKKKDPVPVAAKTAAIRSLRPLLYAAACLLIAVLSVWTFMDSDAPAEQELAPVTAKTGNDTYEDDMADYVMVDNNDIYACLMNE